MSTALLATTVAAAVLFGFSVVPFSAVLAAITACFLIRPGRRTWPPSDAAGQDRSR